MILKIPTLKFLRSLPEEWDTQTSIIRHQYDLSTVSLDDVYGILKTHELEVQQRKAGKENRLRSLALRASVRKDQRSYAEKPRNRIRYQVSDTDILSVPDESSGDNVDDSSDEAKMQEIMACIAQGLRKVKFGRRKKKDQFKENSSGSSNEIKRSKVDWSKIKCFNCDNIGHYAQDSKKLRMDGGKGKSLFTSTKYWMESSSESEGDDVNYALGASFEQTQTTDDSSTPKV